MAKVTAIKEGFAKLNPEGFMEANCSCTLVQSPDNIVIIDTLTPWDGPFILNSNNNNKYNLLHNAHLSIFHI